MPDAIPPAAKGKRSPAKAAAILPGLQKADVSLQSASDSSSLAPGYHAAWLQRQKPILSGPTPIAYVRCQNFLHRPEREVGANDR